MIQRMDTKPAGALALRKLQTPQPQRGSALTAGDADYRGVLLLSVLCGVMAVAGYFAERAESPAWIAALAFGGAYLAGGWQAGREVWSELRRRRIDVDFLMIVVAFGAWVVKARAEGATLLFLFSLSNALEQFAQHRARKTIDSLLKGAPKRAWRRSGVLWVEVPIEEVRCGDELLIKPGELFPVDGVMTDGATSADESALTGESIPMAKRRGDRVSGGTLNVDGQAVIRVEQLPERSAVQRILALIESAQQQKSPAQRFTDTFGRYYTWAVLAFTAVFFAVLLGRGDAASDAFYRAMTLLVVASPCALVLSIPSTILVAIAAGARQGILFRGGVAVEKLADVDQFAFDKTGTLTKGNLRVAGIEVFGDSSEGEALRLAASVGQFSTHPLSRAIVSEAKRRGVELLPTEGFQNHSGLGMEARCGTATILIGSRALLASRGMAIPDIRESEARVEVWVASATPLAVIQLSDELRPEAKEVIAQLQREGAAVTLLTGDRTVVANEIAGLLGIRDVRAELSPAGKLACIHGWQAEGRKVAMVGDGINDAPSLTAADVAIGMGARGSDAALEQADVVLMHDKLENVATAVALSRRARGIVRQNLVISLGVVCVLVLSVLFDQITLSLGVVGHEGSTVLVVLNGLRLLRATSKSKTRGHGPITIGRSG